MQHTYMRTYGLLRYMTCCDYLNEALPCRMPTIDPHIGSRHEGARITDQEDGGSTVLAWLAQLAEHILCRPISSAFGILLEQCFDHGCHDVAWTNSVDANAVLAPFRGQIAGELHQTGFTGVVRRTDEALKRILLVIDRAQEELRTKSKDRSRLQGHGPCS